jgi:MarR family transcriptional regulator, lower aerobic nicotinate degradation pathway regulator
MKIVVKTKSSKTKPSKTRRGAPEDTGEQVFIYEPLTTLNRLMRLHQCLWASFSANLESQYEISVNEFRVLMMAGQIGETASHEIADSTGMPVMAISRTIAALEKRGLIERNVDTGNRRRKPLKLTARGQRLFEKMMPTTRAVAKYLFDSLRLDEILSFDHCLEALTERVTQVDERGESVFIKQTKA